MTDKEELKKRISSSSTRILILNDTHFRDNPPRNCTSAYLDDIFEVLDFSAKLEKALHLDAVVIAGDVFDHKQPSKTSHRLVLRAIEAAKKFTRLIIVAGNHDISNDRLETISEQQPLGVLFESGAAEELIGWHSELPLYGAPWNQNWEENLNEVFQPWRSSSKKDAALAVTHASIFPPGHTPPFEFLAPDVVATAMGNAGSVQYGHIHDYHGLYEVDGVKFSNPGAVSRGSLTESNIQRGVKGALWTPEHGFLEIDMPHRPAEEIFLIEQASSKKAAELSNEEFLADVGSTRLEISTVQAVTSYIRELDESKVPSEVKRLSIELLEAQDV